MMTRQRTLVSLLLLALAACTLTPAPEDAASPTAASPPPSETPPGLTSTPAPSPTPSPTEAPTDEPKAEPTATSQPQPTAEPPTPEPTLPPFEPRVGLELVAEGLTAPVSLATANDGSGRLFIADQIGVIHVLTAEGQLLEEPFLDIRDRMIDINPGYDERGLLGLAFDPDYEESGLFAVYYSASLVGGGPARYDHTSQLSWFTVSEDDPNVANPDSEISILRIDQPQGNHNGGEIAFGPDRYLYVALGDGGGANDVGAGHVADWYEANRGGNGQDVSENLLGSILRIDVETPGSYLVPVDNPFSGMGAEGLPEIWAYGLRNPYRFSFDAGGDHDLFVADVGQNLWEEVSIVTRGGNYGWNVKEGAHCFSPATPNEAPDDCPDADPDGKPLIDPIIEYQNVNAPGGLGLAVVGGYVYRGETLPAFVGRYVFGDWSTSFGAPAGALFVATPPEARGEPWSFQVLEVATSGDGRLGAYLLGFGQDAQRELYALTSGMAGPRGSTGRVWRIVPPE
jgi:glucose/arabinose dehydrogenase